MNYCYTSKYVNFIVPFFRFITIMSMALLTSTLRTLKNVKDEQYSKMSAYVSSRIEEGDMDYGHITRKKTRLELIMISAAVCGIEFCYAAETAFVSPTLLKIGVPVLYMSWIWCLSPLIGLFLVPIFGSLSDRCNWKMGRRRPFIILLSFGIFLGLILVPNGQKLGAAFGDDYEEYSIAEQKSTVEFQGSIKNQSISQDRNKNYRFNIFSRQIEHLNESEPNTNRFDELTTSSTLYDFSTLASVVKSSIHPFSIFFTVLGVVVLDFSCDACQSPCRAYMVDVTIKEDHGRGLVTFTIMAGFGGAMGYILGGINWEKTQMGGALGGHIKVVFTIVFFLYLLCVCITLISIREVPLERLGLGEDFLEKKKKTMKSGKKYQRFQNEDPDEETEVYQKDVGYGTEDTGQTENFVKDPENQITAVEMIAPEPTLSQPPVPSEVSLKTYLLSIVHMPRSLLILCLTNLFCWMSLVCYSLYFTDFVGQAVYGGNPSSPRHSSSHKIYDLGVRMGSFGMALYSISCSFYSLCIERLVEKFGKLELAHNNHDIINNYNIACIR